MSLRMPTKSNRQGVGVTRRAFGAGAGAAAILAGTAPFNIVRAQGASAQGRRAAAALGRAGRHRPGLPARRRHRARPSQRTWACLSSTIMNADTETNVEVARSRAEKLIGDGAQLLVGAFDSGQSTAIAQVAEQKGIPYVINIAAAPPITEQGYKFVFRNFPTAPHDPAATPSPTRRRSSRPPARRRRRSCSCTSTTRSAPR